MKTFLKIRFSPLKRLRKRFGSKMNQSSDGNKKKGKKVKKKRFFERFSVDSKVMKIAFLATGGIGGVLLAIKYSSQLRGVLSESRVLLIKAASKLRSRISDSTEPSSSEIFIEKQSTPTNKKKIIVVVASTLIVLFLDPFLNYVFKVPSDFSSSEEESISLCRKTLRHQIEVWIASGNWTWKKLLYLIVTFSPYPLTKRCINDLASCTSDVNPISCWLAEVSRYVAWIMASLWDGNWGD